MILLATAPVFRASICPSLRIVWDPTRCLEAAPHSSIHVYIIEGPLFPKILSVLHIICPDISLSRLSILYLTATRLSFTPPLLYRHHSTMDQYYCSSPPSYSQGMNKYWIPHKDIHKKVIMTHIQFYLGSDATVRSYTKDVSLLARHHTSISVILTNIFSSGRRRLSHNNTWRVFDRCECPSTDNKPRIPKQY